MACAYTSATCVLARPALGSAGQSAHESMRKEMTIQRACESDAPQARAAGWGAVFAMTLCVATLIASEFMPVSLLTPIAADLDISEGQAGQSIAVSGVFAVLTSLVISQATRGVDRRLVLLALTFAMFASGIMVA